MTFGAKANPRVVTSAGLTDEGAIGPVGRKAPIVWFGLVSRAHLLHDVDTIGTCAPVGELAADNKAVLLANHGPVVAGTSLEDAAYSIEEPEETAKLFLLLGKTGKERFLDLAQVDELVRTFR